MSITHKILTPPLFYLSPLSLSLMLGAGRSGAGWRSEAGAGEAGRKNGAGDKQSRWGRGAPHSGRRERGVALSMTIEERSNRSPFLPKSSSLGSGSTKLLARGRLTRGWRGRKLPSLSDPLILPVSSYP